MVFGKSLYLSFSFAVSIKLFLKKVNKNKHVDYVFESLSEERVLER